MTKKRLFGELELAILALFKTHDQLTVKDVLKLMESGDKYTTLMTVMSRLVEKKELQRERIGLQYHYSINPSKKSAPSHLLERLKQKIFGGRSVSMISYLLESDDITEEELSEMEELIQEAKKGKK
ncbi:MAG TPA: BlaI/MecI/CopY family transcriptional regulator [Rhabdochlamydiaceae bacterium]|jgi:BlaI family penicillinase repressor|nr:BlaI/MecI/CopY family transcriptional regulator [Rhabdochlamydiaceae bacterium]